MKLTITPENAGEYPPLNIELFNKWFRFLEVRELPVVLESEDPHPLRRVSADEVTLYLDSPFQMLREIRANTLHLKMRPRQHLDSEYKSMRFGGIWVWMDLLAVCRNVGTIISEVPLIYFGGVHSSAVTTIQAQGVIWELSTQLPNLQEMEVRDLYLTPGVGPPFIKCHTLYLLEGGKYDGIVEIHCTTMIWDRSLVYVFPKLRTAIVNTLGMGMPPTTRGFPGIIHSKNRGGNWMGGCDYLRWQLRFFAEIPLRVAYPFDETRCRAVLKDPSKFVLRPFEMAKGRALVKIAEGTGCVVKIRTSEYDMIGRTELLQRIMYHLIPDPFLETIEIAPQEFRTVVRYVGTPLDVILSEISSYESFLWVFMRLHDMLVACDVAKCVLKDVRSFANYAVTESSVIVPIDEEMPRYVENDESRRRELTQTLFTYANRLRIILVGDEFGKAALHRELSRPLYTYSNKATSGPANAKFNAEMYNLFVIMRTMGHFILEKTPSGIWAIPRRRFIRL